MRWFRWAWLGWMGAVAIAGCTKTETAAAPVTKMEPAPDFRHQDFYDQLRTAAESFTFAGGDWLEDYGDAPFYGLGFYANTVADPLTDTRVQAARARALAVIDGADFFKDDVQELVMSALGLIAYLEASSDRSDLPQLDEFIDRLDALVGAIGYYVQPDAVDSWALQTYGSTAISALIGLVNTEYALRVGGERASDRLEWAVRMEEHIAAAAFDGSRFAISPNRAGLFLYPHVAMAILEGRLWQLTGNEVYRARALTCHQAIQPLKLSSDPVRYYSPYSAESMGAKTNDYSTLSSHNYLMLALAVLYRVSGEADFVSELDGVLDMAEEQLLGSWCLSQVHTEPCTPACGVEDVCVADSCTADHCSDGVLHHFMDGKPAQPTDPEYFCSGCNVQLLYVMWYRQHAL